MLRISPQDINTRLAKDNPWWAAGTRYKSQYYDAVRREYFDPFAGLATDFSVKRAAILLGPRRVGKTVILQQLVDHLIAQGVNAKRIMYVSIDAPVYARIPLENFLDNLIGTGARKINEKYYLLFDEIQYLKEWEVHLKDLVDRYPNVKFVASGSAAAELALKSRESGAGRFSDVLLPPLTFLEFVRFLKHDDVLQYTEDREWLRCNDVPRLNSLFIDYLNYGGFPELAANPAMRGQADQFIRNDIVDKVLLKDLPNLYGIDNTQELNSLFSFLAYNTAQEASLEAIAQNSGLHKSTIGSYITYLENAFLISTMNKVPTSSKGIIRKRNFKVFLVNPSMRAALFGEVSAGDDAVIGHLAESAVMSQWNHLFRRNQHYYYRDKHGNEVDLVSIDPGTFHATSAVEIKWSDRTQAGNISDIKGLIAFAKKHRLKTVIVTSRQRSASLDVDGIRVVIMPTSLYCLNIGAMASRAAIDLAYGPPEMAASKVSEA